MRPIGQFLRSCSAGFTLIEVLVTLVILSTGIVVVLQAFDVAVAALGEARDTLWANAIVREKLAEAVLQVNAGEMAVNEEERGVDRAGHQSANHI